MNTLPLKNPKLVSRLEERLSERVLVFDGAMGTMIQDKLLEQADFHGERLAGHEKPLKGNNDILSLTQPQIIREIHLAFLAAGADIIGTNTFNSTSISQADYNTAHLVNEMNLESARIARSAADDFMRNNPGRECYVLGALGPTNRTASLSPDVNRPEYRNISFNDLRRAYAEATSNLAEGGADLLVVETVFDTLNCKAALFGIDEAFERLGCRLPVIVSGTIVDASGRSLSGQTDRSFLAMPCDTRKPLMRSA